VRDNLRAVVPSRTRRNVLRALATVAAGGIGGCLGSPPAGSPSSETGGGPTSSPTATPGGPVRAEGEPISADRAITDEPGYTDDIEYFPANGTVRYVAYRPVRGPESFETWTFAQWGRLEAATVAAERAREVTQRRLGVSGLRGGITTAPDADETATVAIVSVEELRNRQGTVVETPAASLSALVEVAPRSVAVTLSLDGDPFSREVPVFASFNRLRYE
jgi:hypothetical protein